MKEINFAREMSASCKALDIAYCKIPDSFPVMQGGKYARFTPPKPFDAFMVYSGVPYCMEYKMVQGEKPFPFDAVRPHQKENLLSFAGDGAVSLLIINYRFDWYEHGKGEKIITHKYNRAVIMDIAHFIAWEDELERKSIPFETMASFAHIERIKNPNGKGRVWDIKKLIKLFT